MGALWSGARRGFAPRLRRHTIRSIWRSSRVASFAVLAMVSVDNHVVTVGGSIAIDGPALFLQGTLLLFAVLSVLTMSERFGGRSADAFTPMGSATPGSPAESAADRAGYATSEAFPLTMFAVFGMLMFVAANDLITMFVALEVLSLPLYVLTGLLAVVACCRRRLR